MVINPIVEFIYPIDPNSRVFYTQYKDSLLNRGYTHRSQLLNVDPSHPPSFKELKIPTQVHQKKLKETWRKAEPSRRLGRNGLDWKKHELLISRYFSHLDSFTWCCWPSFTGIKSLIYNYRKTHPKMNSRRFISLIFFRSTTPTAFGGIVIWYLSVIINWDPFWEYQTWLPM